MKKILTVLALIMLVSLLCFALTSCLDGLSIPGITDQPNNDGNGGGLENEGASADDGNKNINTVNFRYSNQTIYKVELAPGEGLDATAVKAALAELGHSFNEYSLKTDFSTLFSLENGEITSDINVYCRQAYIINYYYGDAVLLTQKIDSRVGFFSQEQLDEKDALVYSNGSPYQGMYLTDDIDLDSVDSTAAAEAQLVDFRADVTSSFNVYCKYFHTVSYYYSGDYVFRQKVDAYRGFTEKQITTKNEYLHHGFHFSDFYADETLSQPMDYTQIPIGSVSVYCDRDNTKAGRDVSWHIEGTKLIFEGTGPMYEFLQYDTDVPWRSHYMQITEIEIAEGITTIANCAFYGFTSITDIVFPETVVHIGERAFYNSSIANIVFPSSLRTIGEHAFHGCNEIVHLNFNPGLEVIQPGAFYQCYKLSTVVLTDTIMKFGSSAFKDCVNISSAYYIGTEEQYDRIQIYIDNFWINELAHTYFISDEEPAEPGPYWYYDENGNIKQWYYTIWYLSGTGLKVPFKVDYVDVETGIEEHHVATKDALKFEGYGYAGWKEAVSGKYYDMVAGTVLTEDLKLIGDRGDLCGENLKWAIKRGVLTISKIDPNNPDGALWDFERVTSAPWHNRATNIVDVIISDGVTYIGDYAFTDIVNKNDPYSNFTYIDIPKSVTEISADAFSGCLHLLYIFYEGTPEELWGDESLGKEPLIKGMDSLRSLENARVYANLSGLDYSKYVDGAYWSNIKGGGTTRRVAWVFDEESGLLLVGGGDHSNIMLNYDKHADTPWYSYRNSVKSISINENITTIGHHSFEGMSTVENILVTRRIAKTSATAFVGTGYYTRMYNDLGVVYIYTGDPEDTDDIVYSHLLKVDPLKVGKVFVIQERTLSIAEQAFEGCSGIRKLVMTKDIRTNAIYSTAFSGLTGLSGLYYEGLEETWSSYENTLTGKGEILEFTEIYFYSSKEVLNSDKEYWHWNDDKTEPVEWWT